MTTTLVCSNCRHGGWLQISSAFGRALGTVDRERVVEAVYATLRARKAAGASVRGLRNVIAAAAEGYPFPTNLDRDRPVGTLTPRARRSSCGGRWRSTGTRRPSWPSWPRRPSAAAPR